MTPGAAVLAGLLLLFPTASTSTAGEDPSPGLAAGDRIPAKPPILLSDLQGREVDLAKQIIVAPGSGARASLLVFWATWCQPCIHEVPDLKELQSYYGKDGLRVIGIGVGGGDDAEALSAEAARLEINYPVLFDKDGSAGRAFQVRALPMSALVDGRGVVRWIGPRLPRDINARIRKAVAPDEDGDEHEQ